ncbi:MAG: LptF/LptG family permease [Myxococcota bacterium]|nr:LptF/LptG family permease [Myxococcota bacterium]
MRRLPSYFIAQMLPWFGLSIGGLTLAFLTTQLVRVLPIFAGADMDLCEAMRALMLLLAPIVGWALTPAFAISIFFTTARMASDGEIVAMHAAGLGWGRLAVGPVILAAAFSFASGVCWLHLGPRSHAALQSLALDLVVRASAHQLKPGHFISPMGSVAFFANSRSADGQYKGIFLEDRRHKDYPFFLLAESGTIDADTLGQGLVVNLGPGMGFYWGETGGKRPPVALSFETLESRLSFGTDLQDRLNFLPKILAVPTGDLFTALADGSAPHRWRFEFWRRVAGPVGFLAMALVSIYLALGLGIRRSGIAVTSAVLLFFVYHLSGRQCESLHLSGQLSAPVAALAPAVVIGIVFVLSLSLRKI